MLAQFYDIDLSQAGRWRYVILIAALVVANLLLAFPAFADERGKDGAHVYNFHGYFFCFTFEAANAVFDKEEEKSGAGRELFNRYVEMHLCGVLIQAKATIEKVHRTIEVEGGNFHLIKIKEIQRGYVVYVLAREIPQPGRTAFWENGANGDV